MHRFRQTLPWFMLSAAVFAGYIYTTMRVNALPRKAPLSIMELSVPPAVQILMSGGDKYLAANAQVFRIATSNVGIDPRIPRSVYPVVARAHRDVSLLNPYHEDNIYLAAVLMPWEGYPDDALVVLDRAIKARTWDDYPPYLASLIHSILKKDYIAAAKDYEIAAARTPNEGNRQAYLARAARLYQRLPDPNAAVNVLQNMAAKTKDPALKNYLLAIATRMQGLQTLRAASDAYQAKFAKPPQGVEDLLSHGFLQAVPQDPLGLGYQMDDKGQISLMNRTR